MFDWTGRYVQEAQIQKVLPEGSNSDNVFLDNEGERTKYH